MPETRDLKSILKELRRREFQSSEDRVQLISRELELLSNRRGRKFDQLRNTARKIEAVIDTPYIEQWDDVCELLPELIRLAKIPSTKLEGFCLAVQRLFKTMRSDAEHSAHFSDAALLEVDRRLRAAQDAIMELNEKQRLQIGSLLPRSSDEDVKNWVTWIPTVLRAITMLTLDEPYQVGQSKPKKGRPKEENLHPLIEDLLRIARAHGGKFTLSEGDRNRARGTIVDALHLLRPVLPPGLVPDSFAYTTIKELRKHALKTGH
jgi:hypothetical protein